MMKVWYHQIWIQNYLGFIVSDLTYIHFSRPTGFLALQTAHSWSTSKLVLFKTRSNLYVLRFVFSEITKLVQTHRLDKVIANCVGNSTLQQDTIFRYCRKKATGNIFWFTKLV